MGDSHPHILRIDRSDPVLKARTVCGGSPNYLRISEQDTRALKLTSIDFSRVQFLPYLRDGESVCSIDCGEQRRRCVASGSLRLDFAVAKCLVRQEGQKVLRWLFNERRIWQFQFPGTVIYQRSAHWYFMCGIQPEFAGSRFQMRWKWLKDGQDPDWPLAVLPLE